MRVAGWSPTVTSALVSIEAALKRESPTPPLHWLGLVHSRAEKG